MFVTSDAYLLQLLRDGKVDAEIAVRLGITSTELRLRIERLCRSAGVSTRDELRYWIETVDTVEWQPESAAPEEPAAADAPPRKRRAPVVVGTVASMAAAMLGLAGLVNLNDHPSTQHLAPSAVVGDSSDIPAPLAVLSGPPAAIGPDYLPERAISLHSANQSAALPPGTALLVEVNGVAIERLAAGADGSISRDRVLAAPSDGELTSTAALPTGAIIFAAVCDGGACDSANGAGSAWTTFYRSDNLGETWIPHSDLEGRWKLVGIDNGRFVANREDGSWFPAGSESLAGLPLVQWNQKLAIAAANRDQLVQLGGDSRPMLTLPMGGGGQIESAWWMASETAITWTPQLRPGSTYYTGIYGRAYGNAIAEFESGEPLDVRGALAPGLYVANSADAPVILSAEDGAIAPIANLPATSHVVMVIPR